MTDYLKELRASGKAILAMRWGAWISVKEFNESSKWVEQVTGAVSATFGGEHRYTGRILELDWKTKDRRVRRQSLQAALGILEDAIADPIHRNAHVPTDPTVFIVHGHDTETKLDLARTIARVTGREPIILHEQPDEGRTIVEKLEYYGRRAAFAFVLMTPDDIGGAGRDAHLTPRARQNVVLEAGWFLGRLSRTRVVLLFTPGLEIPSDLAGMIFKPIDAAGAWKADVCREMRAAGLPVDANLL